MGGFKVPGSFPDPESFTRALESLASKQQMEKERMKKTYWLPNYCGIEMTNITSAHIPMVCQN